MRKSREPLEWVEGIQRNRNLIRGYSGQISGELYVGSVLKTIGYI